MPDSDILELLLKSMKLVGGYKGLTGEAKKDLVLDIIVDKLGVSEELEVFVDELIDILIDVESGNIVFNKVEKNRACWYW